LPGQSDALLIRTMPSTGGDRESVIVAEQISRAEHRLWRLEAL
jgi:hypothetical protein